ncbi:hypothetical protein IC235_01765 [Hymenobacter sp. BT664]|uniref:Uncharacterized protein n=1 Tax=Hymenobacter montanus TaxID=2771359 RepID=A0A927GHR6_9BACT|nr:hypothetical protein [Hymenobacter montanus]MBD2766617.1 hypothetical protein [Hymenobacter montanus]
MSFSLHSLRVATTVLAFASLSACSKKKDDPAPAPAAPATGVSWTIDGSNVTAAGVLARSVGTGVIITASTTSNTSVILGVARRVGTYALPDPTGTGDQAALYSTGPAANQTYNATAGTITVTSVTATNIVGTFTFTGSNGTASKTVSNGQFNVNF